MKPSQKVVNIATLSGLIAIATALISLTAMIVEWKTNIERDIREHNIQTEDIRKKVTDQMSIVAVLDNKLEIDLSELNQQIESLKKEINGNNPAMQKIRGKWEMDYIQQNQKIKELEEAINQIFPEDALVGAIVSHALPPEVIVKKYGEDILDIWAPADGREISTKAEYAVLTGRTELPDLRGVFIRGLNEFEHGRKRADGKEDPDGEGRHFGGLQGDSIRVHTHNYLTVGFAQSYIQDTRNPELSRWFNSENINAVTKEVGGKETRPINVAVYYYIKIN